MFTSEQLVEDTIYARKDLRDMFDIKDSTINNGVFLPKGYQSIWLFVTENKTKGSPQYKDLLYENLLYWDGQTEGHTDRHIISHAAKGFEILVFYRARKREFPHGGFRYEGLFRYIKHEGSRPTQFLLERVATTHIATKKDSESLYVKEVVSEDNLYAQVAKKSEDNLKRDGSDELVKRAEPLKLIYCYAHQDRVLRDKLDKHLSVLHHLNQIVGWYDHEIKPGVEWEEEIGIRLNTANIILLLVSPDFMYSKYCYGVEMQRAIERHDRGEAKVIPIILRPINGWQDTPIGKLQALPTDGKPVVDRKRWPTVDYALENVAIGIREVINQ
jgi:TIR domain